MKKSLFLVLIICLININTKAEKWVMVINNENGTTTEFPVNEISNVKILEGHDDSRTVTVNENNMQVKFVDLGLPSGTLWADRNLGATAVGEYGNYFAWAETTTKTTYSWDTYLVSSANCGTANDPFMENNAISKTNYDAAKAVWGGECRMPTSWEFQELINECNWTLTTVNGAKGYLISSKKAAISSTIFLPFAGWYDETGGSVYGMNGYYWTGDLYEGYEEESWCMKLEIGDYHVGGWKRFNGLSIRPVISE